MKRLYYLIVLTVILGLVLTGCFLSNVGQVPTSEQSGVAYLTKNGILDPDLVGLWHLDELSGTTASDSSGVSPSNDGTLLNFASPPDYWVTGMFGQALSFDGDNDYVDCGNVTQLDGVSEFTVEFWIKVDSLPFPDILPTSWQGIIARGGGTKRTPWVFSNKGLDNLYMQFETTTGGVADCSFVTNDLTAGQWQHVAFTWDGGTVTSYIDGVPGPTDTTGGDVLVDTDGSLKLGYIPGYSYFDGTIDEVRIWNTASPSFKLTLTQDTAFNPVGTEHIITATVTIGETEPAPGVLVDFNVSGVNSPPPSSVLTDINGQATFAYTGSVAGMDTITAEINEAPYAYVLDQVDKYWLENFVTGGGKINKSTLGLPGKGAALTFAGTIGVLEDEGIVGQFQIVDHANLLREGKGAVSLHCNNFTYLEFSGEEAESPEATHNIAIFEGWFTSNRGDIETLLLKLKIIDNGEPGARVDTFSTYDDEWYEWPIDGGNFQVHDIEY